MKRFLLLMTFIVSLLKAEMIRHDQYVCDTSTELDWQDAYHEDEEVVKTALWSEAVAYCQNLKLGSFDDWRLPSNRELLTLVDYENEVTAISEVFRHSAGFYYWSGTSYAMDKAYAWGVDFSDGKTNIGHKKRVKTFIRCVRTK